jgi:UPF0755 protein
MKYLGLIATLVLLAILSIIFFSYNSGPVSVDTTNQEFVINQGDGLNTIASRLSNNRLIHNKYIFLVLCHQLGLNNRLQAGSFQLSPSMSTKEIILKLSKGGSRDYWLKIIEGQRIAEINPTFDSSLEGYLFPDSYSIPETYTQDQIVGVINQNFTKKLAQAKVEATNAKLTDQDAIIFASLLEREGRSLVSKQHIAGILLNRLGINMALQIDASIQYARDTRLKPKIYWTPVTKSDLEISSPYNTYHYPGLPPGPICNPGYDSIYAVYHPINSDYLFYITGNDHQMHYAKTLDEHNLNIAKYLK